MGRPSEGERQLNVRERTILDLVVKYKHSGPYITTEYFFTLLQLACVLISGSMDLLEQ